MPPNPPSDGRAQAMSERFVSETIIPVTASCDTSRMAAGEPGLPREFSRLTIMQLRW